MGFLADSCLAGKCAPGWSASLPPIGSPAGMVMLVVVGVAALSLGAFFGGGGRQRLKSSPAGSVIGIIVIIAVVYLVH